MIPLIFTIVALILLYTTYIRRELRRYEEERSYAIGRRTITSLHEQGLHDEAYTVYRETRLNLSHSSYSVSDQERRGIIEAHDQLYPFQEGISHNV